MTFDREHLARDAASLAARGVFIGTSSWKYRGWCGQLYDRARYVYRGKFSEARLERLCLLANSGQSHSESRIINASPYGIIKIVDKFDQHSLEINAVLCVFNMLPLPPLDGGRVAVGVLPNFLARPLARVEPYGMLILMLLFIVSYAGADRALGFSVLGWLIGVPAQALIEFVLRLTGHGQ